MNSYFLFSFFYPNQLTDDHRDESDRPEWSPTNKMINSNPPDTFSHFTHVTWLTNAPSTCTTWEFLIQKMAKDFFFEIDLNEEKNNIFDLTIIAFSKSSCSMYYSFHANSNCTPFWSLRNFQISFYIFNWWRENFCKINPYPKIPFDLQVKDFELFEKDYL